MGIKPKFDRTKVQTDLTVHLAKSFEEFFKDSKLDEVAQHDTLCGALLTLAARDLAYVAANFEGFDARAYIQQAFDTVTTLYEDAYKTYKCISEQNDTTDTKTV
jgi:hypothetical protein